MYLRDLKTVKPPNEWSFPYLLGLQPWHLNLPAQDTVAYWPLLGRSQVTDVIDADDWAAKISLQFDVEEQAADCSEFFSDPLMPESLLPLTPVLLARLWCPIPMAIEILGSPLLCNLSPRAAVAIWERRPASVLVEDGPPDVAHFQRVLKSLTRVETSALDRLVLIASIGWNYESRRFTQHQRSLMKKCGFLHVERRPDRRPPVWS